MYACLSVCEQERTNKTPQAKWVRPSGYMGLFLSTFFETQTPTFILYYLLLNSTWFIHPKKNQKKLYFA